VTRASAMPAAAVTSDSVWGCAVLRCPVRSTTPMISPVSGSWIGAPGALPGMHHRFCCNLLDEYVALCDVSSVSSSPLRSSTLAGDASARAGAAVLLSAPANLGYGALFALVLAESAGVPVPGEPALLAAGALAGAGKLSLPIVIAVAAIASIIGDNLGYWLGRRGGRRVFASRGPLARQRRKLLERGEHFFARHGAKTVFVARWITGVRVVAAVVAGASAMPWRTFLVFNIAGVITWASVTACIAATLGPVGVGIVYGVGLTLGGAITLVGVYRGRRRSDAQRSPTHITPELQPDDA